VVCGALGFAGAGGELGSVGGAFGSVAGGVVSVGGGTVSVGGGVVSGGVLSVVAGGSTLVSSAEGLQPDSNAAPDSRAPKATTRLNDWVLMIFMILLLSRTLFWMIFF
jgi:hypothetical protein